MSTREIYFHDIPLIVEFDYQPYERPTWDDPGCKEDVDLLAVKAGNVDIIDLLPFNTRHDLRAEILYRIKKDRDDVSLMVSKLSNEWAYP